MTPEEEVINSSSLCKFRRLRLQDTDLLNLLIGKTVSIAIVSHSKSRSNPYFPIEMLRLRSKQLRKVLYQTDESVKKDLPQKNVFGYDKAQSHGLPCMQMQATMVIFAANIKRIIRLM